MLWDSALFDCLIIRFLKSHSNQFCFLLVFSITSIFAVARYHNSSNCLVVRGLPDELFSSPAVGQRIYKQYARLSYRTVLENTTYMIEIIYFWKKAVWQTHHIGTPAVFLCNKHSLCEIPLCIIAIFMTIKFGVEVDFDVEFFIFLGDNDAVHQQSDVRVADSSLLYDLLN